ncbi:sugar transferase [Acidimangrovimonas sediminis]|uniref:sugar transferase n=1 Tax=Acidimangrovimonas sediminis TaxID=2056283 RepID=UPI000C7FF268|nr:sugar transferase [Acidimangrovimonas sediminis]
MYFSQQYRRDSNYNSPSISKSISISTAAHLPPVIPDDPGIIPDLSVIIHRPRTTLYRAGGKRLFDLVLASALLAFFLPFLAVAALVISLDGGRPVFAQIRVGRGGRPYRCYKLRSMVRDAEPRLARLLASDPEAATQWARDQKLTCDPRITRLGHLLRKSSFDELPQLWNVLRGDMSLVGPRPVVPEELSRYGGDADAYLRQRPGVSGAWQVSGRNDTTYAQRVCLDVAYDRDVSLATDLGILLRTVGAVLRATGK